MTSWYPDLVTSAQSEPGVDMLQGWMMASTQPQTPALHLQYQRFIIKDPVRAWRHSCVFRCSSEIFHILLFRFDNRRVFYTRFYFEDMFLCTIDAKPFVVSYPLQASEYFRCCDYWASASYEMHFSAISDISELCWAPCWLCDANMRLTINHHLYVSTYYYTPPLSGPGA